jgi:hypothetical protein
MTGRRPSASGTSKPPSENDNPGPGQRLRGPDALGLDLDADHLEVWTDSEQAVVQLEGGHRGRIVAEVDDDGRLGRNSQRQLDVGQPTVDATQPVQVGRPPRHDTDRPGPHHPASYAPAFV